MTDKGDEWFEARKRPVAVEARGPFEDERIVDTIEGNFEIDDEYLEEHGAYYLVRGVEGEVYPCAADIFEETYEVPEGGSEGWYYEGEPMTGVRVIEEAGSGRFIVTGYTESRGLVAYEHRAPLSPGESLSDYCREGDEHVRLGVVDR